MTQTKPKASTGRRIIGFFDVEIGGWVLICGFGLMREGNGVTVSPPRFASDFRRRVDVTSPELSEVITRAAVSAYRALGGDDLPTWCAATEHRA